MRSTLGSVLSWCCLFAGLLLIADLALTQPLARLNEASSLLYEETSDFDRLRAETARAERVSTAIATDPIFRDEWLRREWGIDLPETIEQVRVEDELRLRQPETNPEQLSFAAAERRPFRPWALPLDLASRLPYPRLVIVVLLAIGILAPSVLATRRVVI